MAYGFLDRLATPSVRNAQAEQGSLGLWDGKGGDRTFDRFGAGEAAFIAARDSFYLATVSESGWPYVQHRGGPPGFLKLLDDKTLAFPDYRGNRQYISLGNIKADDRVCLILVDYPHKARLKVLAHMHTEDLATSPDLAIRLLDAGYRATTERAFVLSLETFDWNCPQHIRPRYTSDEVETSVAPLRRRLEALESDNARLAAQLLLYTNKENAS
jgi:predicted pyridoxine 5'-phosphate oxidase superfamily flavin-nucleotide-binding protein